MAGQFDGYVTPVEGGYSVAAGGRELGVFADKDEAIEVATREAGRWPVWWVDRDGRRKIKEGISSDEW